MALLHWISDNDLISHVKILLNTAIIAKKKSTTQFGKNVIDPFGALFEIAGFNISYNTWEASETVRQAQKSLQNSIGDFHQNILGNVNGWTNKKKGWIIDLESSSLKIVAEVKNKYNTVKQSDLSKLYYALENTVNGKNSIYRGYTAYYVTIIPKKNIRFNQLFTPSDNSIGARCPPNNNIREIDGASFYSMVTGDTNALFDLYSILPKVIDQCLGGGFPSIPPQLLIYFRNAFG